MRISEIIEEQARKDNVHANERYDDILKKLVKMIEVGQHRNSQYYGSRRS
jgi:hypothetical protein